MLMVVDWLKISGGTRAVAPFPIHFVIGDQTTLESLSSGKPPASILQ
jgi:hypothetical protein